MSGLSDFRDKDCSTIYVGTDVRRYTVKDRAHATQRFYFEDVVFTYKFLPTTALVLPKEPDFVCVDIQNLGL